MSKDEQLSLYTVSGVSDLLEILSATIPDGAAAVNRMRRSGCSIAISAIEIKRSTLAAFELKKLFITLMDQEIAILTPFQNGVVPACQALALGDGPEQFSRPIGKPFHLFHHQVL